MLKLFYFYLIYEYNWLEKIANFSKDGHFLQRISINSFENPF